LFQLVAGDLHRPLGTGWEQACSTLGGECAAFLVEDITAATYYDPKQRLQSAAVLANRQDDLKARIANREAEADRAERDWCVYEWTGDIQEIWQPDISCYLESSNDDLTKCDQDLTNRDLWRIAFLAETLKKLADCHNRLGRLLKRQSEAEEAKVEHGTAILVLRGLIKRFPENAAYLQELAETHTSLASLCTGDHVLVELHAAFDIYEKLAGQSPTSPELLLKLGTGYCHIGEQLLNRRGFAASIECFEKAIQCLGMIPKWKFRSQSAEIRKSCHSGRAKAFHDLAEFAEAVKEWDSAIDLCSEPERLVFRASAVMSRLQAGLTDEAINEVADLTASSDWNTNQCYDFTHIYAVASTKFADKKTEYADRAMELLQKAIAAGNMDIAHMAKDRDIDPLRERADFKELLESLEKPATPLRH